MNGVCSNSLNSPPSLAHKNQVPLPHQVEAAEPLWSSQEVEDGDPPRHPLQQCLLLLHGEAVPLCPPLLPGEVALDITRQPLPRWRWVL